MASLVHRFWKAGNAAAVWMYRRTGGKVGGRAKGGSLVLLLTVAGRRSGLPHTVPVAYVERDGSYYLAATAGGLRGRLAYTTDLFEPDTIGRLVGHLERLLEQVAADAEAQVAMIGALLADPGGAARLGAAAREQVVSRYAWPARLAALDALMA